MVHILSFTWIPPCQTGIMSFSKLVLFIGSCHKPVILYLLYILNITILTIWQHFYHGEELSWNIIPVHLLRAQVGWSSLTNRRECECTHNSCLLLSVLIQYLQCQVTGYVYISLHYRVFKLSLKELVPHILLLPNAMICKSLKRKYFIHFKILKDLSCCFV